MQDKIVCNNYNRLVLQFHITGRCNLRCKHCYREAGEAEPLTYLQVFDILEQFKKLCKEYNALHHIHRKGHVNLTGGEPFIREDFIKILEYFGENKDCFTYGILSNGSFLTNDILQVLKDTCVSFVQLSIDGNKKMHDYLRAPGDYDRVFRTAEFLEKNGIRTYISFTANRRNYKYLPKVAIECRRRGITKLWSDRLVPVGQGKELQGLVIEKTDFPRYVKRLKRAQGNWFVRKIYSKTRVAMNRALQFQKSKGIIYSCSAGKSLITVDEFGNVMPCRRMPLLCGNALDITLSDVYWENEVFRALRLECMPKACMGCKYVYFCKGGAKCQSYAKYQNYNKADPGCPLAMKENKR